jgi:hypothetical protein
MDADGSFRVLITSPSEYEELVAEIFLGDKFVALISQESGVNRLKLELPGPGLREQTIARSVDLDAFLRAVEEARTRLAG